MTKIRIQDQLVDADAVSVPKSRDFRDAWALDGDQIVVDPDLARPIFARRVNEERKRRLETGTTVSVTGYGDIPIQGRPEDQQTLTALALGAQLRMAQGDKRTTVKFRDMQNTDHDLTAPQLLELWQHGAAHASRLYAASWAIKAMDPLTTDETSDALWP